MSKIGGCLCTVRGVPLEVVHVGYFLAHSLYVHVIVLRLVVVGGGEGDTACGFIIGRYGGLSFQGGVSWFLGLFVNPRRVTAIEVGADGQLKWLYMVFCLGVACLRFVGFGQVLFRGGAYFCVGAIRECDLSSCVILREWRGGGPWVASSCVY